MDALTESLQRVFDFHFDFNYNIATSTSSRVIDHTDESPDSFRLCTSREVDTLNYQRRVHTHAHFAPPILAPLDPTREPLRVSTMANGVNPPTQHPEVTYSNNEATLAFASSLADRIKQRGRRGATKTPNKDEHHNFTSNDAAILQMLKDARPPGDTATTTRVTAKSRSRPAKSSARHRKAQPPAPRRKQVILKRHNLRRSVDQSKEVSPTMTSQTEDEEIQSRLTSPARSELSTIINEEVARYLDLQIGRTTVKRVFPNLTSTATEPSPKRPRLDIDTPSQHAKFSRTSIETSNALAGEVSDTASSPLSELADEELENGEFDEVRNSAVRSTTSALGELYPPHGHPPVTEQESPEFSPLTPALSSFPPLTHSITLAKTAANFGTSPKPAPSPDVQEETDVLEANNHITFGPEPQSVADIAANESDPEDTIDVASPATNARLSNTEPRLLHINPRSLRDATRPLHDVVGDTRFRDQVIEELVPQAESEISDVQRRQARRILALLQIAQPPIDGEKEASFLSGPEAADRLRPGIFDNFPIFTESQQPSSLQTIAEFLEEFYDDDARVSIQDPAAYETDQDEGAKRAMPLFLKKKNVKPVRQVTVRELKKRFSVPLADGKPWNCLELATPADDGYRPQFLNTEDCRLLTKLKVPGDGKKTSRREYHDGYKEVEKWALLGQAALTEPHQDSHGYSTYITVNEGLVGFGWLSNPTEEEREDWGGNPMGYLGGRWRYVIVKPGQTVYFPAGTVHFVFRMPSGGNTLSFGGHVLRCSNILHWMKVLRTEKENRLITNEDIGLPVVRSYLARVERYVKQAERQGNLGKWGGEEAVNEFLSLKRAFLKRRTSPSTDQLDSTTNTN